MIIAVCVDKRMGMRFNGRRQSSDRALRQDLISRSSGRLWMSPDSATQFEGISGICPSPDYLESAGLGEYCFVEETGYLTQPDRIEKILLYRWDRVYPADTYFTFPGTWRLSHIDTFPGSSHESITCEVYIP